MAKLISVFTNDPDILHGLATYHKHVSVEIISTVGVSKKDLTERINRASRPKNSFIDLKDRNILILPRANDESWDFGDVHLVLEKTKSGDGIRFYIMDEASKVCEEIIINLKDELDDLEFNDDAHAEQFQDIAKFVLADYDAYDGLIDSADAANNAKELDNRCSQWLNKLKAIFLKGWIIKGQSEDLLKINKWIDEAVMLPLMQALRGNNSTPAPAPTKH